VSKSLILEHADVDVLAMKVADVVTHRVESILGNRERRLVDRPAMARLANIGTATLDRLVTAKRIPSILVGRRRLFDPDAVVDALSAAEVLSDV
jgi:hypothetical protein